MTTVVSLHAGARKRSDVGPYPLRPVPKPCIAQGCNAGRYAGLFCKAHVGLDAKTREDFISAWLDELADQKAAGNGDGSPE